MNMRRKKHINRRRFGRRESAPFTVSFLLMAFCYLAGCLLGSRFGLTSEIPGTVFSIMTEQSDSTQNGFLAVFGSYGFYGVLFLLLSTTYLGFLLVPPVFALKGFLIGTLFLTYLQSEQPHSFLLAGISLCLPELFVLPALLLLGGLCMQLSFRLLCRFRGAPAALDGERHDRTLAIIFVLLILAAVIETYVVPTVIRLVPA